MAGEAEKKAASDVEELAEGCASTKAREDVQHFEFIKCDIIQNTL